MSNQKKAELPQLYAGASRKILTYPENFFPHKGFRGRYFTGIHDELHVRTLYLECGDEAALLVALELGDIGSQWLEDIGNAVGIPADHVFLTVSHTHSAPHIDSTWKEDVIDVEKGEQFAALCHDTIIESALEAKEASRPAGIQYDTGSCDININRDYKWNGQYIQAPNPYGRSDKTVRILKFTEIESGKTIAYVVNYAIHSLVTFYQTWTYEDSMLISSDLAGAAMQYVEDRIEDDAVAMFVLGASADQMPRYIANHREFDTEGNVSWQYYGREAGYLLTEVQAVPLAKEILQVGKGMNHPNSSAVISVTSTIVSSMGKIEGMRTEVKPEEVHQDGNNMNSQYKETIIPGFHYTPTEPISMKLGLLRIGGVSIITIPAEIVNSIGARLSNTLINTLGGKAMVISQCNGAYSYITDDEGYHEMTFEALSSHFMPGIGDALERGASVMAEELAAKSNS